MVTENVTLSPDDDSITYRGQHLQLEASGLFWGNGCLTFFWVSRLVAFFGVMGVSPFPPQTHARMDGKLIYKVGLGST